MNILLITPTSVTIELNNDDYYITSSFDIFLNDKFIKKERHNVFSIYDLTPNKEYKVKVCMKEISFKTLNLKPIILNSLNLYDDTSYVQEYINNLKKDEFLILKGIFNINELFINSFNTICLDKDSKIIGMTDRYLHSIFRHDDYLNSRPKGSWEGKKLDKFASTINILGKENVTIYGKGLIDFNASNSDYWENHRVIRGAYRPVGIYIHTSKNINLCGLKIKNSPSWTIHPFYCLNLNFINLKIINPIDSPTTDGIDPESSKNVNIIGSKISVGDDCIAIKSGRIEMAKEYMTPSENIIIRNCLMTKGHAGLTLGSEASSGINNLKITKCIFNHTDRGLRIKSQRGRGNFGVIENIVFDNIKLNDVKSAFVINMFYMAGTDTMSDKFIDKYQKRTELTPKLNSFYFSNIICDKIHYGFAYIMGLPESKIDLVSFENITISYNLEAKEGNMAMSPFNTLYKNAYIICNHLVELRIKDIKVLNKEDNEIISNDTDILEVL